ncbi:DUF2846 domain-containing protein [Spirosoma montaniterrae]|uniref:Uncharacterized protein n=1 Tax=Spirosoma montaniterrae TaxID=1178516 RepID=A0A1P9WYG4_9BACT|nr:DUF2846 domain-containing protein [Spirosoma montaniterrae]AQG80422.1 hypothetical protein AWR27_14475 [Spirosoma montaniterrae]
MRTLFIWWFLGMTSLDHIPLSQTEPATLIIYRQREFGSRSYTIYVNGKRLSWLSANRYLQAEVPAGRVSIESKRNYFTENKTIAFPVEPGRTYYVKAVEDVDFLTQSLLLARVRDEQAKPELKKIKPMEPDTETNPNNE